MIQPRGFYGTQQKVKLVKLQKKNEIKKFVETYCLKSRPKIGIEGEGKVNHFKLIEKYREYYKKDNFIVAILRDNRIDKVVKMIEEINIRNF